MSLESWVLAAKNLKDSIGSNNFTSWIEPLKFVEVSDHCAKFCVPTSFFGHYVEQNYAEQIIHHMREAGAQVSRLAFTTQAVQAAAVQAVDPGVEDANVAAKDMGGIKLDSKFTFENFVVGKPNELAHAAARRVAEGGEVTFNPLFLYGGVGLGKTHLMHAIAWELQTNRPDLNVMCLSAEQFMYRFVQALRERKMMDFKELFRSVDVLMVDDVQFIAGKDSTQEEFFHTFNALVDQNKQIIISADRAPSEIKELENRIASRLQCGLVVDLHPTTYELRLGILQTKIEFYKKSYPNIHIGSEVVEFLANRISNNVRVLEGALTRLYAFASLIDRPITIDMAQDCLADVLRASDRKITVEDIQRKVADHYNIRLSDMLGPKRLRNFARPRQIAMYLCKELTTRSLPEIGRRFGGRDHTTVMHGVRRVEELRNQDSQISDDIDMLRRALEG